MSDRIVAFEIVQLAALAQVSPDDVQHFIAVLTGPGDVEFVVPGDHCAVIVAVETINADDALPKTASRSEAGAVITEVQAADWTTGGDLFYVYPPGKNAITVNATPEGGKTLYIRAVGYFLPQSAYARLARMATKILS